MIEPLLACVETRMREVIDPSQKGANSVCRAALHHLAAGGNRVRANLSLNASLQLRLDTQDVITLATICELLHNASLIQDDLIDRAPTRRGFPSVWAAFDDSTAVCAGDLLLASAFALVGELRCVPLLSTILALVHQRTRDVILGQGAEQAANPETLECYESIAVDKSASLLSLPLELSLVLSGNQRFLATAQRAADAFAAAYQMIDDLADYSEDVRNGSLNVVSVALVQGCHDYESACAFVLKRAEELICVSIDEAAELPQGCGAAMIAYAEQMRLTLCDHRSSLLLPVEQLRHGR